MRHRLVYALLYTVKHTGQLFYTYEEKWVGEVPENPWSSDYQVVAILNHTSLYEFLLASFPPDRFLLRMAWHGVVPVASKTINRPLTGKFWRIIAGNVVPISRERDHTWKAVMESIDPRSMVVMLPEGRMKRANGLDAFGRQLVVRGGIADVLEAIPDGKMLVAYSQGLHHIQIPGQSVPNLFKPVRLRLEEIDIAAYREEMAARDGDFRAAVVADLMERRDRYCTSDVGEIVEPADA